MKKTLVAAAVLGAFAGSALAANVTLYGVVDYAFDFHHVDSYTASDGTSVDSGSTFKLSSGAQAGSRWGMKGVEKISDGLSVGFVLESGFSADTGASLQGSRLFGRESILYLDGTCGKLALGRASMFSSDTGSFGVFGRAAALGDSWSGIGMSNFLVSGMSYNRADNAVTYLTPSMAGFQFGLQFSGDINYKDDGTEYKTSANRYASVMGTYDNGPLSAVLIVDGYAWSHDAGEDLDDGITVSFGGNFDFGPAKLYFGAQYFDNMIIDSVGFNLAADIDTGIEDAGVDGYTIMLGVSGAVAGGNLMFGLSYVDADVESVAGADGKNEFKRYGASLAYTYPLSKRTNLYGALGYVKDEVEYTTGYKSKPDIIQAYVGLRHRF